MVTLPVCHIAHKTLRNPETKTWNVNPAMCKAIAIVTSPECTHLSDGIFGSCLYAMQIFVDSSLAKKRLLANDF